MKDGRTQLYRHFDDAGALLYVGISLSALYRLTQHRDNSAWFDQIARVAIECFPTRVEALAAERRAIIDEKPLHNLRRHTETQQREVARRSNESKEDLTRRIVEFNPVYTPAQVSELLDMPGKNVARLIEQGRLGHIITARGIRNTRVGPRPFERVRITGWQLIEFIEALERARVGVIPTTAVAA